MAVGAVVVLVVLVVLVHAIAWGRYAASRGEPWRSLAPRGPGFRTSSALVTAVGRHHVRAEVEDTLEAAFAARAAAEPGRRFVIAETGWRGGGPFPPHRTHREGLSVDVVVPVADPRGEPAQLGTWPWTLWGYCWHLDDAGAVRGLRWAPGDAGLRLPVVNRRVAPCPLLTIESEVRVDFESLASLLLALDEQARAREGRVTKIIVAPAWVERVLATDVGSRFGPLAGAIVPPDRKVWVRHDDHVHVDFSFE